MKLHVFEISKQCESNKSYLNSIIMKLSSSMFYGVFDFKIDHLKDPLIRIDIYKLYRMVKEK